jgi:hypothetical protein
MPILESFQAKGQTQKGRKAKMAEVLAKQATGICYMV